MTDHEELIELYRDYGSASFTDGAPLYAQVCRELGDYPEVVEMLAAHEPEAHHRNLLFAAVHYLLFAGLDHPLGQIYDGTLDEPVGPALAMSSLRTGLRSMNCCALIARRPTRWPALRFWP